MAGLPFFFFFFLLARAGRPSTARPHPASSAVPYCAATAPTVLCTPRLVELTRGVGGFQPASPNFTSLLAGLGQIPKTRCEKKNAHAGRGGEYLSRTWP
ncbi:hypothetical protein GQ53DRAFT_331410 [Thozetella sp. PMI_491]|nr:hypothetical protein GQ53DRAFT_331410 [Thozetella sp. PMI_491]